MDSADNRTQKQVACELFLLSVLSLFFELIVIRWMSADIRAFTVLKSFPLAACYIGLGLGFASNSDRTYKYLPGFFLAFCLITRLVADSTLGVAPFPSSRVYSWFMAFNQSAPIDPAAYLVLFMIGVAVVLAGPFLASMAIGARLGVLFSKMRPINAYSINLGGALLGTIAFSNLSFMNIAPAPLMALPLLILAFFPAAKELKARLISLLTLAVCLLVVLFPYQQNDVLTLWSPYERIDLRPVRATLKGDQQPSTIGWALEANKVGQQKVFNVEAKLMDERFPSQVSAEHVQAVTDSNLLPFKFKNPPGDVLSLASGLGNDVSAALKSGASTVEAVEIDPVTITLGKQYNKQNPYGAANVTVHCDDARHFLERTSKKYDVIRFAFLDSMTVLSSSSTSRLDNYVYTKDSIQRALKLLKPDGLLFISFYAKEPWFINRLYWTIQEAAGYKPLCFAYDLKEVRGENVYFILSKAVKDGTIKMPADLPRLMPGPMRMVSDAPPAVEHILTDDWPFLYWAEGGFDLGTFAVSIEVILLALFFGRRIISQGISGPLMQMFFLGSAFLLLELQSIARFSLLFGSSWRTSSVVIAGVLIMLLGANIWVMYKSKWLYKNITVLYVLLFLALIVSFLLPVSVVLNSPLPDFVSYTAVTLVTLSPMFLAGLIFGSSFDQTDNSGRALGFNLLGGVLGALLEYFVTTTGIRGLVIVALVLYMLSLLSLKMNFPARTRVVD